MASPHFQEVKSIHVSPGKPSPFGATPCPEGINFALYSPSAVAALLLFELEKHKPFFSIALDPKLHKTEDVWHICLGGLPEEFDFSWKIGDKQVCDPYAKAIASPRTWRKPRVTEDRFSKGRFLKSQPFDWQSVAKPKHRLEDLIIYEMHVRGFTEDRSSQCEYRGTYLGVIEKIPYLRDLGINAVELLPVYEFDETANKKIDPVIEEKLCDYWGYNPMQFFCPMKRYAHGEAYDAFLTEFKTMVREFHRNGIEVILDVVYNHTGEGNEHGPYTSWKGVDGNGYYLHDANGAFSNYTGCGNTFACNREPGQNLILESMRYFANECQVDGFRFDLASILTRGDNGGPLPNPHVLIAMQEDPLLKDVKLIPEPWDAGGLYQVGEFPKWGAFSEWNGRYRDAVRRFLKGTETQAGAFATAISGSQDLYANYPLEASHSINFVTCHDGYSLWDMVSYQDKHNIRNGEDNQDGANQNDSWNCGHEGPTDDPKILALRNRQMRNFFTALLLSKGIPMLLMGDEYGMSHMGNNNTWCQDHDFNWFDWSLFAKQKLSLFRFVKKLIRFRLAYSSLRSASFLNPHEITWHGFEPEKPDWCHASRFVGLTRMIDEKTELYAGFNAHFDEAKLILPSTKLGAPWRRLIDTNEPSPADFLDAPKDLDQPNAYLLKPYSTIVLIAGDLVSF